MKGDNEEKLMIRDRIVECNNDGKEFNISLN